VKKGVIMTNLPIQSFKLAKEGLTHIFGELEARLVEAVWDLNEANVQDVIDHLGGDLNYKTTMTVLNRLVEKGVLTRRRSGRAFVYSATATRQDLLAGVFDQMVRGMFNTEFREIALTQMIETAESLDPQILDDLSDLIRQRKKDE
jgi:predicted transcriptional regulator